VKWITPNYALSQAEVKLSELYAVIEFEKKSIKMLVMQIITLKMVVITNGQLKTLSKCYVLQLHSNYTLRGELVFTYCGSCFPGLFTVHICCRQ